MLWQSKTSAHVTVPIVIMIDHAKVKSNLMLALNIYIVAALRFARLEAKAADLQTAPWFSL